MKTKKRLKTDPARSAIMRAVKSRNTKPELMVRKIISQSGIRYRLHKKNLPGSPDIVFSGKRKAIFVHGCFWHGHDCARGARIPKTNTAYWRAKIARNQNRDRAAVEELSKMDWKALIVWECGIKDSDKLSKRIAKFLAR
jgi:DNA mismatch endonuclease (patch repair protein)